ncbi:hypothetical protein [Nostoc sp.]
MKGKSPRFAQPLAERFGSPSRHHRAKTGKLYAKAESIAQQAS